MDFDAIVIGSGFGGAVTACRLAEAGARVLILERGRRWDKTNYPRKSEDPWIWDAVWPELKNGWLDMRVFDNISVVQGAGVGGGSLLYSNVSLEAAPERFNTGWPPEITYAELKPYYDRFAAFLNPRQVPDNQWTSRMKLLQSAAANAGLGDRFSPVELAVSFDPDWTYAQDNPHDPAKSKRFMNAQGVEQGTCVHLGNCVIGCDVDARNTLDRNYIALAEQRGAEVRPLHLVNSIEPVDGGYRVWYDELRNQHRIPGNQTAAMVIVAAGSLGSTELLLRCRDVSGTLPAVSPQLGRNWSSNGNFMTPGLYTGQAIAPGTGPTIGSEINLLDGSRGGSAIWVEDGGIPDSAVNFSGLGALIQALIRLEPLPNILPLLGGGIDAGDGVLSLISDPPQLDLQWNMQASQAVFDAISALQVQLIQSSGGVPLPLPAFLPAAPVCVHPLGGCGMGATVQEGVVDHRGAVFGYENLFVADAAILPRTLGTNPSRTIGAVAERIAALIIGR